MSEIHIEGMGLLGSMLARRLDEEGVSFTWNDTETPFTAWHVSTGLAYPDGDASNQAGLKRWYERLSVTPEAAAAPYVFAHKKPPHKGSYDIAADYGSLRMAEPAAVALNVPKFVENTRERFAAQRLVQHLPGDGVKVVCHTTEERGDGYLWGWVARVKFDLLPELSADVLGEQPALYAKAHRFNLTYAYPIPGTGEWWAGSVLQMQRTPRKSDDNRLFALYQGWLANAEELLKISNVRLVELNQGWRPRAVEGDTGWAEQNGSDWVMPPMPTDGMRRGWLVVDNFLMRAGLL